MTDREEVLTKALRGLVEASTLGVKMLDICGESKEADNLSGAISTAEKVLSEPSRTREEILEDAKNHTAYYEKVMESLAELRESFALCEKQWREESYNSGLAAGRAERAVEPNKTEGWEERFSNFMKPKSVVCEHFSTGDCPRACRHNGEEYCNSNGMIEQYRNYDEIKHFISAEIAKAREEEKRSVCEYIADSKPCLGIGENAICKESGSKCPDCLLDKISQNKHREAGL